MDTSNGIEWAQNIVRVESDSAKEEREVVFTTAEGYRMFIGIRDGEVRVVERHLARLDCSI
jgi:hypothetical protein